MSINLSVTHNPDEFLPNEALAIYLDYVNGYVSSVEVFVKTKNLDEILEKLSQTLKTEYFKKYDYSINKSSVYIRVITDLYKIYIQGNNSEVNLTCLSKSEDISHTIWKALSKYIDEPDDELKLFFNTLSLSPTGISENSKILSHKDIAFVSEKYYPYINVDVLFEQFFTGPENILLLVGKPGLGKSKFATLALKYAMENPDKIPYDKCGPNSLNTSQYILTVSCKNNDVLADDSFWKYLEKNKPDFCIVDDLDYMLTRRDTETYSFDERNRNRFLSNLLSFTDGIQKNYTKFIFTTNQSFDDIDSAVLRKGRLFDVLELRELTNEEALEVWKENDLDEKEFHKLFKEKTVLPANLGSEIAKILNKRIKESNLTYLKEQGISKLNQIKGKKIKI